MQTKFIKIIFIFAFLCWTSSVLAQDSLSFQTQFKDFGETYRQTNQTGMWILGSWAVGNMLAGGIGMATQPHNEAYYFHQMNAAWNIVNLGLAGMGLYQVYTLDVDGLTWQTTLKNHHQIQKLLLVNAGLDVAYIMAGLYLIEKSHNTTNLPERLSGYGKSLLVQGSFLLLFDVSMVLVHQGNGKKMHNLLEKVQFTGNGLLFRHKF
jgi:hypothetical protein